MKNCKIINILSGFCLLCCLPATYGEVPAVATDENLRAAILHKQSFSATDLQAMDINQDGQLDVADLLMPGQSSPTLLEGFHWVVSVRFEKQNEADPMPHTYSAYSFVLDIEANQARVGSLDEYDPTRNLLDQDVSEAGDIPGEWRDDYSPGKSIPIDTSFTRADTGGRIRLVSASTLIPANSERNPTWRNLRRTWILEIDRAALNSPTLDHGTIQVQTTGFFPGTYVTEGRISLVRAGLINPPKISAP